MRVIGAEEDILTPANDALLVDHLYAAEAVTVRARPIIVAAEILLGEILIVAAGLGPFLAGKAASVAFDVASGRGVTITAAADFPASRERNIDLVTVGIDRNGG